MSRQDQYNVTVSIDWPGLGSLGTWDKKTGGEKDSEETKYRPGGMGAQITLGGYTNTDNVTVQRLYNLTRDHPLTPLLFAAVGKADMVIGQQPLDVNGNPIGSPITYRGKLKRVAVPEHDSESADKGLIELEQSTSSVT
jgi:hypothetical protein